MTRIGTTLSAVALFLLFAIFMGFLGLRLAGLSTFVVMGSSMEPTLPVGSLALVQPATPTDVAVGQVITYRHDGITTTHRVVGIERLNGQLSFTTKGDANAVVDAKPITFSRDVGLVRASVPAIGFALFSLQEYWRLWLAGLAGMVFFWCAFLILFRPERATPTVVTLVTAEPARRRRLDIEAMWADHLSWIDRRPRHARAA